MLRGTATFAAFCILATGPLLAGEESGTTLFLRLSTPLSTRNTSPGQTFEAVVTRPLVIDGGAAVPVGARLQGTVTQSRGVGLGFKHEHATLALRFDELILPGGERIWLDAALAGVDNAREQVDAAGRVKGIRATSALSERMNIRLGGVRLTPFRLAYRSALAAFPWQGMAIWFANGLVLGLADPEIDLPAGTELEVRPRSHWSFEARYPIYGGERPHLALSDEEAAGALRGQPALSYFAKSGAEADPVNLVLIGAPDRAFAAAGWSGADQKQRRTCFRALRATATASPYARGPMSSLLLGGARPASEWQKGLNTYAKRHHLRVWRATETWRGHDVWLVAATHDTGLTVEGRALTHQVDRRIDREREKVIADLLLTGCVDAVTRTERPPAGKRPWVTDHRVAVVRLNACENPVPAPLPVAAPKRKLGARLVQRFTLNARNTLLRENNLYRGYDLIRQFTQWRRQERGHAD